MNKHHKELLCEIKGRAKKRPKREREKWDNYVGSTKPSYGLNTPTVRKIVKGWIKAHPELAFKEYLALLNALYKGESRTERSIAGYLMEYLPDFRRQINLKYLDKWLSTAEGWMEVDSICSMCFTAKEVLSKWGKWKSFLIRLSNDPNVHKRRASLVFLTKPVRQSGEVRLSQLAFRTIDKLKSEDHILITKAVSWLLRDLIKNHRGAVRGYLKENEDDLPRIAVRETLRKLETGRK